MSMNRYYICGKTETGDIMSVPVTAKTGHAALRRALELFSTEYGRKDVRSLYINGDPIPQCKKKRAALAKQRADEYKAKYTATYIGTTRID